MRAICGAAFIDTLEFGVDSDIKLLQFFDSLLQIFQVPAQVLLLARALTYKTHLAQLNVAPEFLCLLAMFLYNLIMWVIGFFEWKHSRAFNLTPVLFYNDLLWVLVTDISYPLMIFFRFHSVFVIFSIIGKHWTHKKSLWWIARAKKINRLVIPTVLTVEGTLESKTAEPGHEIPNIEDEENEENIKDKKSEERRKMLHFK